MPAKLSSRSERGIFVPLSAVVLGAVLALLFATSLDTLLIRLTRSELQRAANETCQRLAYEAATPDFAAEAFAAAANSLSGRLGFAKLEEATLILPLAKEDPLPALNSEAACQGNYESAESLMAVSASGLAKSDFSAHGLPRCNLSSGHDCTLWPYPNLETPPGIPSDFVSKMYPGRTVGCSFSARVTRYSAGQSALLNARAVYILKPRGGNVAYSRGLRIAVATEMSTPMAIASGLPRNPSSGNYTLFNLSRPLKFAQVDAIPLPFLESYDPFCAAHLSGDPAGSTCTNYEGIGADTVDWLSHLKAFSFPRPITPLSPYYDQPSLPSTFMRGFSLLTPLQREEMITSCLNPPVLIRNIVAETFADLASRDSLLRQRTEILHINPANVTYAQNISNHSRRYSVGSPPNYPTVMVPFGADIAASRYQLPYVVYREDDQPNPYQIGGNPAAPNRYWVGLGDESRRTSTIYPFNDNSSLSTAEQRIHSQIANQLRACYHLYTGMLDGASQQESHKGISRFTSSRMIASPYHLLSSGAGVTAYDPVLYPGSGVVSGGRYGANGGAKIVSDIDNRVYQPQDQEDPWGGPNPVLQNSRLLNASELLAIMGSTQRCPFSSIGDLTDGSGNYITRQAPTFGAGVKALEQRCPSANLVSGDAALSLKEYPSKENLYEDYFEKDGEKTRHHVDLTPDFNALANYLIGKNQDGNAVTAASLQSPVDYLADIRDFGPFSGNPEKANQRLAFWTVRPSPGLQHDLLELPNGASAPQAVCPNAPLVILLHRLPLEHEENEAPKDGFSFLTNALERLRLLLPQGEQGGPAIVFFVPSRPGDLTSVPADSSEKLFEVLSKFQFGLSGVGDRTHKNLNAHLFVLAPRECLTSLLPSSDPSSTCSEGVLTKYWSALLNPSSPNYLVPQIRRAVFDELYRVERVL